MGFSSLSGCESGGNFVWRMCSSVRIRLYKGVYEASEKMALYKSAKEKKILSLLQNGALKKHQEKKSKLFKDTCIKAPMILPKNAIVSPLSTKR